MVGRKEERLKVVDEVKWCLWNGILIMEEFISFEVRKAGISSIFWIESIGKTEGSVENHWNLKRVSAVELC
jgi:hypothetical protein